MIRPKSAIRTAEALTLSTEHPTSPRTTAWPPTTRISLPLTTDGVTLPATSTTCSINPSSNLNTTPNTSIFEPPTAGPPTPTCSFPKFLLLPPEIQLNVASHLPLTEYAYLLRTSHYTKALLTRFLHLHAHTPAVNATIFLRPGPWRTPLHAAAAAHDIPLLTSIIRGCIILYGRTRTAAAINRPDIIRMTPLLSAVLAPGTTEQRVATIQVLKENGAKSERSCLCFDKEGPAMTCRCGSGCKFAAPLWWAGVRKEEKVEELLWEEGVDTEENKYTGWWDRGGLHALRMVQLTEARWTGVDYLKRKTCPGGDCGAGPHRTQRSAGACSLREAVETVRAVII